MALQQAKDTVVEILLLLLMFIILGTWVAYIVFLSDWLGFLCNLERGYPLEYNAFWTLLFGGVSVWLSQKWWSGQNMSPTQKIGALLFPIACGLSALNLVTILSARSGVLDFWSGALISGCA